MIPVQVEIISPAWAIRSVNVKDIPDLVNLRLALFESMGYTGPDPLAQLEKDSLAYFQEAIPKGEYLGWVAKAGVECVATGGLVFRNHPPTIANPSGCEGYIMGMYTKPEWRHKGIGQAILRAALQACRRAGAHIVSLRATEPGRPLYEQHGFVQSNEMVLKLVESL